MGSREGATGAKEGRANWAADHTLKGRFGRNSFRIPLRNRSVGNEGWSYLLIKVQRRIEGLRFGSRQEVSADCADFRRRSEESGSGNCF